jgi:hypothetical protein
MAIGIIGEDDFAQTKLLLMITITCSDLRELALATGTRIMIDQQENLLALKIK